MEPMIHRMLANMMATLREYLSAMNEDIRAPTIDPAGIAPVIPPCR